MFNKNFFCIASKRLKLQNKSLKNILKSPLFQQTTHKQPYPPSPSPEREGAVPPIFYKRYLFHIIILFEMNIVSNTLIFIKHSKVLSSS